MESTAISSFGSFTLVSKNAYQLRLNRPSVSVCSYASARLPLDEFS